MSDTTTISYADHTWSPWFGCELVSQGCAHCYASAISKRAGRGAYRHGMPRTLTKDWEKPKRWNKAARAVQLVRETNERPRVLVSMCDPFDAEVQDDWRMAFFDMILSTPNLDWLVLTNRPENALRFYENHVWKHSDGRELPSVRREQFTTNFLPNVWLGVSAENQEQADKRIPILLSIPARVHWVSYEPALGPVELGLFGTLPKTICPSYTLTHQLLNWVVVGGESGFNHRKLDLAWVRSVVNQCKEAGVPCFVKQDSHRFPGQQGRIPADLWAIKQFPSL